MTRNEAAERLLIEGYLDHTYDNNGEPLAALLNKALAEAKAEGAREAVERIRARLEDLAAADRADPPVSGYLDECVYGIMPRILNEELAR